MKTVVSRFTLFCISFLLVSLLAANVAHSQGFMKNAVAIWLFDEGKGKQINDFARNRHDGKFSGKPEWVPGKFGTALKFAGEEEATWVDIERPVVVDSVDITIGCWLYPGSPQLRFANVLSGRPAEDSSEGISLLQYENTVNNYRVAIGGVFNWQGLGNPRHVARLLTDVWTHLVFVREGRGGTWYVNGEPDRRKVGDFYIDIGNTKPANPTDINFRIGAEAFGGDQGRRYRGILDEAFIFERALSQEEVQRIMNEGIREAQNVDTKGKAATVWGKIKSPR